MSHLTTMATQLRDHAAISAAVRECGGAFTIAPMGQKLQARAWGGSLVACDALITIPNGQFDIALQRQADGTYQTQADFWDGSLAQVFGKGLQKLTQLYGVHRATLAARQLGKQVIRQTGKNGAVVLRISGGY